MIRLSALADEISPDLDEQIAVLQSENIHFLDLRGVWGINVLDLTDQQAAEIKKKLDEHGLGVAAIGSPIGKAAIDSPFPEHLQRFERAISMAKVFDTSFIRIFSFYPPGETSPQDPTTWRTEVINRLQEMTRRAREEGVILLHENEKDIYGDTIVRNLDILSHVNNPNLQAVFDPAN